MAHFVYLLACADRSIYTRYTTDPERRVHEHQSGKGAKYTRSRRPVRLLAYRECPSKGAALSLEHRVRHLNAAQKRRLAHDPTAPWPGEQGTDT